MKTFGLFLLFALPLAAHADAVGVYFKGGTVFSFVRGHSSYVSRAVHGRELSAWINDGCCAGGLSGYYGGGRFNIGTACAAGPRAAQEAAAEACVSRAPYIRCDYSSQVVCAY